MSVWDLVIYGIVPWPIVNLFFLIKSIVKGDDIGFVFYYRWFFRVHGPYDLVLSDFFSRITSAMIVFIWIIMSSVFIIWLYWM